MLELLKEADKILNACGRPVPPKGYRFVDLPRWIPFFQNITPGVSPNQLKLPYQGRVSNTGDTTFICRGVGMNTAVTNAPRFSVEQEVQPAPTGLTVTDFGVAVAQDGGTMVVGGNVSGGFEAMVQIFTLIGGQWALQQTILAPAPTDVQFGSAVAISGDTIVVGAPSSTTFGATVGVVYVYTRTAGVWTLQQTIQDPGPPANTVDDHFGTSVGVSGNTLVGFSQNATFNVHIYTRTAGVWTLHQSILTTITGTIGAPLNLVQIAFDGDTLAIGQGSGISAAHGSVTVYVLSGGSYVHQQTISASDGVNGDNFGSQVALSVNTILTCGNPGGGSQAYFFTRAAGVWSQVAELPAAHGSAVAVDQASGLAFVGDTVDGNGQVYYFALIGGLWTFQATIVPFDGTNSPDLFGGAISIQGQSLLIGSLQHSLHGTVYYYGSSSALLLRIKWPDGRFLQQFPENLFNFGLGPNLQALPQERAIDPGARISIELSGLNFGLAEVAFWGAMRYLMKDSGDNSTPGAASCLVGYPAAGGTGVDAGKLMYIPDPVAAYDDMPRLACGSNQNIMAPEFLLGNSDTDCCPPGFRDESFTFFSNPITVNPGGQSYGNVVIVPGADDVVIRNIAAFVTYTAPLSCDIPCIALRLPNGYSVTGGDMIPLNVFPGGGPMFPTLRIAAGGRLIIDVSDAQPNSNSGSFTLVIQFDGVKRRKVAA